MNTGSDPSVVLVVGGEALLAERAVAGVIADARGRDAGTELIEFDAAGYGTGQLGEATSPSLFGEARVVVVSGVQAAGEAFVTDAIAYLADPAEDVVLVELR